MAIGYIGANLRCVHSASWLEVANEMGVYQFSEHSDIQYPVNFKHKKIFLLGDSNCQGEDRDID